MDRRVETLDRDGVEVGALDQAGAGEHRRDRRWQLALDADRRTAEILERRGFARLHDQAVDRRATLDREGDELGLVGLAERDDLAERSARRELGVVGGDQRVVGGREAGLDLDVEAQCVEVPALLGDEHLDDRRRGGEVEARQVRDRAGGPVRLAAVVGERFGALDVGDIAGAAVAVGVVAAGGDADRHRGEATTAVETRTGRWCGDTGAP